MNLTVLALFLVFSLLDSELQAFGKVSQQIFTLQTTCPHLLVPRGSQFLKTCELGDGFHLPEGKLVEHIEVRAKMVRFAVQMEDFQ
jgi:hypothetical protein